MTEFAGRLQLRSLATELCRRYAFNIDPLKLCVASAENWTQICKALTVYDDLGRIGSLLGQILSSWPEQFRKLHVCSERTPQFSPFLHSQLRSLVQSVVLKTAKGGIAQTLLVGENFAFDSFESQIEVNDWEASRFRAIRHYSTWHCDLLTQSLCARPPKTLTDLEFYFECDADFNKVKSHPVLFTQLKSLAFCMRICSARQLTESSEGDRPVRFMRRFEKLEKLTVFASLLNEGAIFQRSIFPELRELTLIQFLSDFQCYPEPELMEQLYELNLVCFDSEFKPGAYLYRWRHLVNDLSISFHKECEINFAELRALKCLRMDVSRCDYFGVNVRHLEPLRGQTIWANKIVLCPSSSALSEKFFELIPDLHLPKLAELHLKINLESEFDNLAHFLSLNPLTRLVLYIQQFIGLRQELRREKLSELSALLKNVEKLKLVLPRNASENDFCFFFDGLQTDQIESLSIDCFDLMGWREQPIQKFLSHEAVRAIQSLRLTSVNSHEIEALDFAHLSRLRKVEIEFCNETDRLNSETIAKFDGIESVKVCDQQRRVLLLEWPLLTDNETYLENSDTELIFYD